MKIFSIFLLLLLSFQLMPAQFTIDWQKTLGGTSEEEFPTIRQTSDGGYIVAGFSSSNDGDVSGNHGSGDYWVVKLTSLGTISWQTCLGGSYHDQANSIEQTADGGFIVAGKSESNDGDVTSNNLTYDFWVVKLNTTGQITWQKSLGGSRNEEAQCIKQTADGGYVVAGYSASDDGDVSSNQGTLDFWIVKLTASGSITWENSFGGSLSDRAYSIEQTTDGGYIVVGFTESIDGDVTSAHGAKDYWVIKLTDLGALDWEKTYGGSGDDWPLEIHQTLDGGFIVAGGARSSDGDVTGNHGGMDFWLLKLTGTGNIQWEKSLGGSDDDAAYSIQQTPDGGYIVAGISSSSDGDLTTNLGFSDYWMVKMDGTGNIEWERSFGGSENDGIWSIQRTSDGGYVVVGTTRSNDGDVSGNHGLSDFWVIKTSAVVDLDEVPQQTALSIFPNPASSEIYLKIPIDLSGASFSLYNSQGKSVLIGKVKTGDMVIDLENLSAGAYFISIGTRTGMHTARFVKE